MSEATVTLTTIEPIKATKKRGRPAGRRKAVPLPLNTEAPLAKATYSISLGESHNWFISAIAKSSNLSRHEVLEEIINHFICSVVKK